jgi:c(7)-type cytochrome triheme protein
MRTILFAVILALGFAAPSFVFAEGGGNLVFSPPNIDPVTFSHDYHLKTRGIKCAGCHFPTFSANGGGYQIKKEKLNKRDFCRHCHNGMKGFEAESEKNCTRCHKK